MLRDWLGLALPALDVARERIDAVNVFPVPDGDTGTNVLLTVRGAADEVAALTPGDADGAAVLRAVARGALLSARGNSGVILSRYLGGLAAAAHQALPAALGAAAEAARAAVPEPEDGTVLTVAAVVAAGAREAAGRGADEADALAAGVAAGRSDLARISAAHPVLRSARVVDAGACALLVLLDALAAALAGRPGPVDVGWLDAHGGADAGIRAGGPGHGHPDGLGESHDHPHDHPHDRDEPHDHPHDLRDGPRHPSPSAGAGYEVVALLRCADAGRLAGALSTALPAVGDAVAVVAGDGLVTAHVHAVTTGAAADLLAGSGARWTATVRTLHGAARPVVACTADAGVAAAAADAGAVAVLLPGGAEPGEARDAVRRAVAEARGPAADASAPVTVLPGDRLGAADLDPAWSVPGGAADDAGVLAALADPAALAAATPLAALPAPAAATSAVPPAPTVPATPTVPARPSEVLP
ncbi:hypothetical protein Cpa01nite_27950 [Cellulomonas pakistanensis]|uniref:DhaL domain-containing protein n=1 Tax=Cellulomonas pakistanensis TaxID=992287 RepID=A0A919PEG9_9CELL|nr:hypothetical protein Cpa01nite_27950 [Cellulomonas pakistanensis]